jgi:hypothetical protein
MVLISLRKWGYMVSLAVVLFCKGWRILGMNLSVPTAKNLPKLAFPFALYINGLPTDALQLFFELGKKNYFTTPMPAK